MSAVWSGCRHHLFVCGIWFGHGGAEYRWSGWQGNNGTAIIAGSYGETQTSDALRMPVFAAGIYVDWDEGDCGWDFGTSSDYLTLLYLPVSFEEWRLCIWFREERLLFVCLNSVKRINLFSAPCNRFRWMVNWIFSERAYAAPLSVPVEVLRFYSLN